jgi:hypothetical protein
MPVADERERECVCVCRAIVVSGPVFPDGLVMMVVGGVLCMRVWGHVGASE